MRAKRALFLLHSIFLARKFKSNFLGLQGFQPKICRWPKLVKVKYWSLDFEWSLKLNIYSLRSYRCNRLWTWYIMVICGRGKKVTGVTRKSKLYALQFKNHDNHNQQKGANNNSLNIQIKEGSQKSKVNSYYQGFHFEVVLVVIFSLLYASSQTT